jgi:PD-(D/E)XK nuclease superfamily
MRRESLAERAAAAPAFNVFRIIGREHYEITTHSALLASLLNPLGIHAQGDLFLSGFLRTILSLKPFWRFPPVDTRWRVDTEKHKIDILLTHVATPFFIIIENKWFARDQEQQTFRYWWEIRQRHPNLTTVPVIYLTRTGKQPDFVHEDVRFRHDLLPVSYNPVLMGMLEACLPAVGALRVRETIKQYLQLLEDIDEN